MTSNEQRVLPTTGGTRLDPVAPGATAFPQVAEDLQTLSTAHNYHRWVYAGIKGALGSRIVEIGAGIGNYTGLLLEHGRVLAADPEAAYVAYLRRKFANHERFDAIELTLGDWPAETRDEVRRFRPDTFVCMNVLEHVEQDAAAIESMYDCLEPGGHIALVVPAHTWLFSPLDRRYGHFRRYSRSDVPRLLARLTGASLPRCRYQNAAAVPGWWVNHVLLKRERLSPSQTVLFDRLLVPFAAAFERVVPVPIGLSLVLWIRKGS